MIASWTGVRRVIDARYQADPLFYVREHLRQLARLRHSVDRVVVYFPTMQNEPETVTRAIEELRANVPAHVHIRRRQNLGQSYGSFHDGYEQYRDEKHRWWLFVEDDYVPTLAGFDDLMRAIFESEPGCGLCTPVKLLGETPLLGVVEHAGAGIGFTSAGVLERIWERNGGFERFAGETDYRAEDQIYWGMVFGENGTIVDTRGKCCFAYQAGNSGAVIYHHPTLPLLFAPLQNPALVANPDLRLSLPPQPLVPAVGIYNA